MNLRLVVVAAALLVFAGGCGAKHVAQNRLDETLTWYQAMLEKGDFEATALLASDSIARDYQERAQAAKDVRVVGCRVLRVDHLEGSGEAEVAMELEYYSLLTLKARTIRLAQKWVYFEDRGASPWRLTTLLPEFK